MRFWQRWQSEAKQMVPSALSLVSAQPGRRVRIISVDGGTSVQSRLAALGMFPDEEVQVLSRAKTGPLLLMVRGSKLALGRGLGKKVMVEESLH